MVLFGQKLLCFDVGSFRQSNCVRVKWLYSGKVVVFGQSCCFRGKSGCIRAKWLYLAKVVVFGQSGCIRQKWLYSATWLYLGKVVLIEQK